MSDAIIHNIKDILNGQEKPPDWLLEETTLALSNAASDLAICNVSGEGDEILLNEDFEFEVNTITNLLKLTQK